MSAVVNARDVQESVNRVRDAVSVTRVFGEPYEKHGVTVIPAARIWGGGGGGLQDDRGRGGPGRGSGFGSGFGMIGRPAGVFVIRGETVRWQPAVDPNLIIAGLLLVGLTVSRALRRRRRREWARRRAVLQAADGPQPAEVPASARGGAD